MRRRIALGLMLGNVAALASPSTFGQTERPRRIGVIMQIAQSDPEAQARLKALLEELRAFGWDVGKNLSMEYRAAAEPGEISERVSDLLSTHPEVVLAVTSVNALELQKQSPNTPLIFFYIGDPVHTGLIDSIAPAWTEHHGLYERRAIPP